MIGALPSLALLLVGFGLGKVDWSWAWGFIPAEIHPALPALLAVYAVLVVLVAIAVDGRSRRAVRRKARLTEISARHRATAKVGVRLP